MGMMPAGMLAVVVLGIGLLAGLCRAAGGGPQQSHMPLVAEAPPGLPTLRWVGENDEAWRTAAPAFVLGTPGQDGYTEGRAVVTTRALRLLIAVHDDHHINTRKGGDIWDGDALQIGVDAYGTGVGSQDPWMTYTGPHVVSFAAALTADGPRAWAYYHGRADGAGDYDRIKPVVTRDEPAQTTTYDLAIPWDDLQAKAGISPTVSFAVQVNDTDPDQPRQKREHFGGGTAGAARPGLFKRFALGLPPEQTVAFAATKTDLWQDGDYGEAIRYEGSPAGARRERYRVTVPTLGDEPLTVHVGPVGAAGMELVLKPRGKVVADVMARLDALGRAATDPLVQRHFASAAAVLQAEWTRCLLMANELPDYPGPSAEYAAEMLADLRAPTNNLADPRVYRGGRRMLVFGFVASDRTLQHYFVTLPGGFDPAKTYPLIVALHGAGNPHPLSMLAGIMTPPAAAAPAVAVAPAAAEPASAPATQRSAAGDEGVITITPWGRGNHGYGDVAEADVMDALRDAEHTFQVDPDRVYLTGHSMGGGGTWYLGLTRPDLWAAIGIVSGGTWQLPPGTGVAENARGLPVLIWHGTADGAVSVQAAYQMRDALERFGVQPEMRIVEDAGHTPPGAAFDGVRRWLLQHRRQKPTAFAYVAVDARHAGRNGVRMDYDPADNPFPRVACRIAGQTVELVTQGTRGLSVDLGPEGLGLSGDVTVTWNGKKVYSGPAKQIELGSEAP